MAADRRSRAVAADHIRMEDPLSFISAVRSEGNLMTTWAPWTLYAAELWLRMPPPTPAVLLARRYAKENASA